MKLRLGEMTLDLAARQLVRGGDEIHLSPKAFELLKILVENRPRALAKNELHERCGRPRSYPRSTSPRWSPRFGTHSAMMREKTVFVRTAHRFGYAFSGSAVETARGSTTRTRPRSAGSGEGRPPVAPSARARTLLGREPDEGIDLESPTVSRQSCAYCRLPGGCHSSRTWAARTGRSSADSA